MLTMTDLYRKAKSDQTTLLPSASFPWWGMYRENAAVFDRLFQRTYKSFVYYNQESDETDAEVLDNFKTDALGVLTINAKKYAELFRIEQISDAEYSLTNNYDMLETLHKTTSDTGAQTIGSRSDSANMGARTDSSSTSAKIEVSPYDTNSFYNESQNSGTGSQTTGAQTSSSTQGEQHNSTNTSGAEDYTLTRKGNIGVMTATDMLAKHNDFWSRWSFMRTIFNDIARELLHVGEMEYLTTAQSSQGGGGSFDPSEILAAIAEVKAELESATESIRDDVSDVQTSINSVSRDLSDDTLLLGQSIVALQTNIEREIHEARDAIIDEITEVSENGY